MPTVRSTLVASISVVAVAAFASGCGSSKDTRDLGDVTVGANTVHVSIEGDGVTAGGVTQFVVKPTAGPKPDGVTGWVGTADATGSEKKDGVYDPNDGDFDDDVTAPNPIPAGSMYYFTVTTAGVATTASIAY
ncbi:MAG TPA: hypothetical protein VF407_05305 [Polyangiaceae bacterium]